MIQEPAWYATAERVRTTLEQLQSEDDRLNWTRNLSGACDVASAALARLLRREGLQAVFVLGEYRGIDHCWVEFDPVARSSAPDRAPLEETQILDITKTQFDALGVYDDALEAELSGRDAPTVDPEETAPRVYHGALHDDPGYQVWHRGLVAARIVGPWYGSFERSRDAQILAVLRRAEKLRRADSRSLSATHFPEVSDGQHP